MKILIFGQGWIGNYLQDFLKNRHEVRLSSLRPPHCPKVILEDEIEWADCVINTAAKTQIDWCENNKVSAFENNVLSALMIAEICKKFRRQHIFFSSACLFESEQFAITTEQTKNLRFFTENSPVNPKCFYAYTKYIAEALILEMYSESIIIRARLLISEMPNPRNTIDKLLGYPKLQNNQETLTIVEDMLPVIEKLMLEKQSGIFHLINEGTINMPELVDYFGEIEEGKLKAPWYEVVSKEEQDARMEKEGKTKRVTAYVTSTRIPLLPHLRSRLPTLAKNYLSRK